MKSVSLADSFLSISLCGVSSVLFGAVNYIYNHSKVGSAWKFILTTISVSCFCLLCQSLVEVAMILERSVTTTLLNNRPTELIEAERAPLSFDHGPMNYKTCVDGEGTECVVCLLPFEVNDELTELACNHSFHRRCLDEWISKNPTCPSCRQSTLRSLWRAHHTVCLRYDSRSFRQYLSYQISLTDLKYYGCSLPRKFHPSGSLSPVSPVQLKSLMISNIMKVTAG